MRADDDDIAWARHRARVFLDAAENAQRVPRWQESGYGLVACAGLSSPNPPNR